MGRNPKESPRRLAEKLLQIRVALGLSQNKMRKHLGLGEKYLQGSISGYELATRIPPLTVLQAYAEVAGVWVDALIRDDLDLPASLPCKPKSEGISRKEKR